MGCAPVFNSCSSSSVLDGASIVIPLTDFESDHFTDNSVVLYVGHDGPDGPTGEIHEIKLDPLDRYEGRTGSDWSYTQPNQMRPEEIASEMQMAVASLILYDAIENPNYVDTTPVTAEYASGLFDEHNLAASASAFSQYFNDGDNMMATFARLQSAIVGNEALEGVLDNSAIYISGMDQTEWAEQWDNLAFWSAELVDDMTFLETAGDHRGILKEALMEMGFDGELTKNQQAEALQAMGYNRYGNEVPLEPATPQVESTITLTGLGE